MFVWNKKIIKFSLWHFINGISGIYMDSLLTCVQYFEIFVEFLRCFFETFTNIFGVFGYIVGLLEFYSCLRILVNFWNFMELKIFGTSFCAMQRYLLKLVFRKKEILTSWHNWNERRRECWEFFFHLHYCNETFKKWKWNYCEKVFTKHKWQMKRKIKLREK